MTFYYYSCYYLLLNILSWLSRASMQTKTQIRYKVRVF